MYILANDCNGLIGLGANMAMKALFCVMDKKADMANLTARIQMAELVGRGGRTEISGMKLK